MKSIMKITYAQMEQDSKNLAEKIEKKYDAVYGIPAGGLIPAFIVSRELGVPLVSEIEEGKDTLVVDDLIDSGRTVNDLQDKYDKQLDFAVVYKKDVEGVLLSGEIMIGKVVPNEWIDLPHEGVELPVENNIIRLLQYLGEDVNREGLVDTPKRVIKSYKELYGGYGKKVEDILTVFESEGFDEMVILKDIEFFSTCEHHMLPFFGKAHVAYIPGDNNKIVGISKLARIVDIFARRLQNQERLTQNIVDAIETHLQPLGVAVVIEAQHFCMKARGVAKHNAKMKTAHLTGVFRDDTNNARSEFYKLIED